MIVSPLLSSNCFIFCIGYLLLTTIYREVCDTLTEAWENHTLKGDSLWSVYHALDSLKRNKALSFGVVFLLSLGIALPTSVFIWTETGARITVEEYFNDNIYQFRMHPNSRMSTFEIGRTISRLTEWSEIDTAHAIPSTICIVKFDWYPDLRWYSGPNFHGYGGGYKDARIIPMTPDKIELWKPEFEYQGNFSLESGQILVSQKFIDYTLIATGVELAVGSKIGLDVLTHLGRMSVDSGFLEDLGLVRLSNLTIVGIYQIKSLLTQLSSAFPSRQRHNGLNPIPDWRDPVLGIDDSVIILENEFDVDALESITTEGYFYPDILIRGNLEYLLSLGATNAPTILEQTKAQIDENFTQVLVTGVQELQDLQTRVDIYIKSQILTLLVFPVLVMSLMLTVFTSEASINRRKLETQTLRAKGASYSQVVSSFMAESVILAGLGFLGGIFLATYLAPLLGAANSLVSINQEVYLSHLSHTTYQPMTWIIAGMISIYLPGTFLFQTARLVETSEIGQPMAEELPDEVEDLRVRKYLLGFIAVLSALLLMPVIILPYNLIAATQILIATVLLYAGAFYGSKIIRLLTSRGNRIHNMILGEKSLYVIQSFKRRKGHFMPLLVILTLTFSTTTMILIQTASFDATILNELHFSMGADVRIESEGLPLDFIENITSEAYIESATSVLSTSTKFTSDESLMMYALSPLDYLSIADFSQECFIDGSADDILTRLHDTERGVIISSYHADMLGKGVGDTIDFLTTTNNTYILVSLLRLEIVGIMTHAPGFGAASTHLSQGEYLAKQIGFQAARDGFVLVNQEYFIERTDINVAELFLAKAKPEMDIQEYVESLDALDGIKAYSIETIDLTSSAPVSALFLSGLRGHLLIEGIACLVMGLGSIGLFLGSAVMKRKHEYAIIRALGATSNQIRAVVFGEFAGSVVSALIVSTIVGIVFGISMTLLTFGIAPFVTVVDHSLVIPYIAIILTVCAEAAVMTIACAAPASLAGHVEPMSILRNL